MYKGGCIFVYAPCIWPTLCPPPGGILSNQKKQFENWLGLQPRVLIVLGQHMTNNGTFGTKDFVDAIIARVKQVNYCGVGAHHQMGLLREAYELYLPNTMARVMADATCIN